MKKSWFVFPLFLLLVCNACLGQQTFLRPVIDSLATAPSPTPFNGIICVVQQGKVLYSKVQGFFNLETQTGLKKNDQFIIGSISKQITATLVLREYDQGHLQLDDPIGKYIPEITQPWADSVTVSHLL